MERKDEEKANLDKETKKDESKKELGEEDQEMEFPPSLIEAIAKIIKEMRN